MSASQFQFKIWLLVKLVVLFATVAVLLRADSGLLAVIVASCAVGGILCSIGIGAPVEVRPFH
jgi:hypothetical protein